MANRRRIKLQFAVDEDDDILIGDQPQVAGSSTVIASATWSAQALPVAVSYFRDEISRFAKDAGIPDPPYAEIRMAVSEAVANATVHAYRDYEVAGKVEVTATLDTEALRIVVRDYGRGYQPRLHSPGSGMGLAFILSAADHIAMVPGHPGTEVHLTFNLER